MRLISALAAVAAVAVPFTSAAPTKTEEWAPNNCLPAATASAIVTGFASLLTNFNAATANSLLADNYIEYSDSINFLGGFPLGGPTFPSKQAFIAGQGQQPPLPAFEVLNIDAVTCGGTIVFRWLAQVGSEQQEIKGINVFYTSYTGQGGFGGYQISETFSEFNSGSWVVDIGGTCVPPALPTK